MVRTDSKVERHDDDIIAVARKDMRPWIESPYYEAAREDVERFWRQSSIFRQFFDKMNHRHLIELACGQGRHVPMVLTLPDVERYIGIDIVESNIEFCRRAVPICERVSFLVNSGAAYDDVNDGWASAIFCYDAMVHFDSDVVRAYLRDTMRVLAPGGCALFHHSNYMNNPGGNYPSNPHARNFMSKQLFAHYGIKAGLEILQSEAMRWGNDADLDCITLLRRPCDV